MRKKLIAIGFIVALVVGAALPSTALAARGDFPGQADASCRGPIDSGIAIGRGGVAHHPTVVAGGTVKELQDGFKAFCASLR